MAEKARSRASDGHFTEICFHMLSRAVQVNCAKYWDTESHQIFATSLLVNTLQRYNTLHFIYGGFILGTRVYRTLKPR